VNPTTQAPLPPLDTALTVADPSPDPLAATEIGDRILHEAIDRLPDHERETVRVFYFDDLSQEQVARQLYIPAKTFKSRLFSARRHLQPTLVRRLAERKAATFYAFPASAPPNTVAQAA
tara:strand:+ start:1102 stop:1458 length:357 start_codon:yes stop_codon:yes gene_type:complete